MFMVPQFLLCFLLNNKSFQEKVIISFKVFSIFTKYQNSFKVFLNSHKILLKNYENLIFLDENKLP